MAAQILVTGGTGMLGRRVVRYLRDKGVLVRVLSRRPRPANATEPSAAPVWVVGDLAAGTGVDTAVAGVSAIVHCASDPARKGGELLATKHLIDAAQADSGRAAERPHLVYISFVGVDRVPLGYYREKLAAEKLIEASGLPWTILRTTQFHQFVIPAADRFAQGPVQFVPTRTKLQPISVDEVAQRLTELALGPAQGHVPDMAGPQVRGGIDLVRAYLQASRQHRLLVPVHVPGAVGRGFRAGCHLAPDHAVGRQTFEEYLAGRFPPRR